MYDVSAAALCRVLVAPRPPVSIASPPQAIDPGATGPQEVFTDAGYGRDRAGSTRLPPGSGGIVNG